MGLVEPSGALPQRLVLQALLWQPPAYQQPTQQVELLVWSQEQAQAPRQDLPRGWPGQHLPVVLQPQVQAPVHRWLHPLVQEPR